MNFSHFFIRRPIFAAVLSIIVFVMGLIAMWRLRKRPDATRMAGGKR